MAKSLTNYLTYKTKNCWRSVDAQFQNWAGSVSLSPLRMKAACMSFLNLCDQLPCRVTIMSTQTLLMHHWRSLSWSGMERVAIFLAYKGSQYFQYALKWPSLWLITWLTTPKICWCSVDAQFRNWAGSVSHFLLPIKTACTSFMNLCDQLPCRVTILPSQTLLTLRWRSFCHRRIRNMEPFTLA